MDTPICDFVRSYAGRAPLRLHMPGHKGEGPLGIEGWDITEVEGADVLYQARGIIAQSQANAATLFGSGATFYSTEGSSLCIRAMVCLALLEARSRGREPRILAGRNAHKTFLSAAALLDVEVDWLYPQGTSLLECPVGTEDLERAFAGAKKPTAVYLTAPDYLGNLPELRALAEVCHNNRALLLVDNAHGAYLKFLPESLHPMDLGADLCCDSAHKTLPVLTGGAYLHVSKKAPRELRERGEGALALFASTSPSYLILQSLDRANAYLENLRLAPPEALFARLRQEGWELVGREPFKLTLAAKRRGYRGEELAGLLRREGIEPEFADPDFLVLMLPLDGAGLEGLGDLLCRIPRREPLLESPPPLPRGRRVMTPRQAMLAPRRELPVEECVGRVLAEAGVSCPPAVPILVCGEEIDPAAAACLQYYGIRRCTVVEEGLGIRNDDAAGTEPPRKEG